MVTLAVLILLSVLGFVVAKRTYNDFLEISGVAIGIISGVGFLIFGLIIITQRTQFYSDVERLKAFKSTIESSRAKEQSDIERVSILQEISKWNEIIAAAKYKDKHVCDICYPDEIQEIEPIK